MSEVLGDADADDELIEDDDDEEFDDLDELDPSLAGARWSATLTSPMALAITALVLATISLMSLLSTYLLVNAIALAHPSTSAIFGQRVSAAIELGLALLGVLFAILAHGATRPDPDRTSGRTARAIAGAALLLAIVSIVESGGSLLILLGAHVASQVGG
ncbi:MAG TPA: hypothetical protein VK662_07585 [Acidothermaceae bacterium]|jgi:hypothetical protein|nr:hypothetical protein [Acidothermaceae bacterium]